MTHRQTVVLQAWVFAGILKSEQSEPLLQGKQLTVFIASDQIQAFKQNSRIWKLAGLICITEQTKIFSSRQLVRIVSSSCVCKNLFKVYDR